VRTMRFSVFVLLAVGIALTLTDSKTAYAGKEVVTVRCLFSAGNYIVDQCGSSQAGICGTSNPCDQGDPGDNSDGANCAECLDYLLENSFKLEHTTQNPDGARDQYLFIKR
jgi:hypothetical protein